MIIGNPTLISTNAVTNSSSVAITSDITTTYKNYMFVCTDLNPVTNGVEWQINLSIDDGSNWLAKTTTFFRAQVASSGASDDLDIIAAQCLDDSNANAAISFDIGNGSDESSAGILYVYNPQLHTLLQRSMMLLVNHPHRTIRSLHPYRTCTGYLNQVSLSCSVVDHLLI